MSVDNSQILILLSFKSPWSNFGSGLHNLIILIEKKKKLPYQKVESSMDNYSIYIYMCAYIYICVGRSNFVRVCVDLTTLIKKRHILMRTAVLYIYVYS